MNELVLVFDREEVLVIDDFVDTRNAVPESLKPVIPVTTEKTPASLAESIKAIREGKRLIV